MLLNTQSTISLKGKMDYVCFVSHNNNDGVAPILRHAPTHLIVHWVRALARIALLDHNLLNYRQLKRHINCAKQPKPNFVLIIISQGRRQSSSHFEWSCRSSSLFCLWEVKEEFVPSIVNRPKKKTLSLAH